MGEKFLEKERRSVNLLYRVVMWREELQDGLFVVRYFLLWRNG